MTVGVQAAGSVSPLGWCMLPEFSVICGGTETLLGAANAVIGTFRGPYEW